VVVSVTVAVVVVGVVSVVVVAVVLVVAVDIGPGVVDGWVVGKASGVSRGSVGGGASICTLLAVAG